MRVKAEKFRPQFFERHKKVALAEQRIVKAFEQFVEVLLGHLDEYKKTFTFKRDKTLFKDDNKVKEDFYERTLFKYMAFALQFVAEKKDRTLLVFA